jgi:hypothetical protein
MATITHNNDGTITVSVTLDLPRGSLLEMEDAILDGVNEVGCLGTAEAWKRFDTVGSPIIRDGVKWTVRAHDTGKYQTPYGVAEIERTVYQTSKGGRIYCPLEDAARTMIVGCRNQASHLVTTQHHR